MKKIIVVAAIVLVSVFTSVAYADDPLSGVEVTITFDDTKTDSATTTVRADKPADITACVRASAENRRLDYGSSATRAKISAERNQRNSAVR